MDAAGTPLGSIQLPHRMQRGCKMLLQEKRFAMDDTRKEHNELEDLFQTFNKKLTQVEEKISALEKELEESRKPTDSENPQTD